MRCELAWFGHVTLQDNFSNTFLQGTLERGQHRGQQKKFWMDSVKVWTSLALPMPELLRVASRRKDRTRISAEASLVSLHPYPHPPPPTPPTTHLVSGLT